MTAYPHSHTARTALKAAGVVAAFGLFAFLAQGAFGRVPVQIDGRERLVGVGDSVAEIIAEQPITVRRGDLLSAADRRVIVAGGGTQVEVRVNGAEAKPEARVRPGDTLELIPGADTVEPTTEETRAIPVPTTIVGKGAVLTMAAPGSAGIERVVVGAVSGDVVASETVLPATPMVLRRVNGGGKKVVALTFDDGPWPGQTAKILDILETKGVPATFFTVGLRVKREPAVAKRIVAEGHAIGNHTYHHIDLTGATPDVLKNELVSENDMVRWMTGATPKWFRPPMGKIDGPAYKAIKAAGLKPVLWTVDPQDWRKGAEALTIMKSVVAAARPGSVILLHDGGGDRSQTVTALPWIIDELRKAGYEFVLLDDLPGAPKSRW
ncbi:MAG: polysaccharide deacetylase family protein [Actinobacteria bacterium]|nr:MAG: polysaccharide deacetylase family protein [Actinomycetota bacterium]